MIPGVRKRLKFPGRWLAADKSTPAQSRIEKASVLAKVELKYGVLYQRQIALWRRSSKSKSVDTQTTQLGVCMRRCRLFFCVRGCPLYSLCHVHLHFHIASQIFTDIHFTSTTVPTQILCSSAELQKLQKLSHGLVQAQIMPCVLDARVSCPQPPSSFTNPPSPPSPPPCLFFRCLSPKIPRYHAVLQAGRQRSWVADRQLDWRNVIDLQLIARSHRVKRTNTPCRGRDKRDLGSWQAGRASGPLSGIVSATLSPCPTVHCMMIQSICVYMYF